MKNKEIKTTTIIGADFIQDFCEDYDRDDSGLITNDEEEEE